MKAFHEIRKYNSDFMVWQSDYQDISFLAHWHQELELIYISSGTARFGINDKEFTAYEGDLVFVDTGDFHYSDSMEYKNHLNFIVFDAGIVKSHYQPAHFSHPLITRAQLAEYGLEEMTQTLFSSVKKELTDQPPYYKEIVSARLKELVFLLRRSHPRLYEVSATYTHRTEAIQEIQHIMTYIDEHYGENITLSSVARQMNFSESHFSKMFKKLAGINFINYLNAVRIEHAAGMLRNSGAKMTEIALSCGFGNVRSFNRTFKEYTGYTPTQFLHLRDLDARNFSYYKRKLDQPEYVQSDSLTLVKNTYASQEDTK